MKTTEARRCGKLAAEKPRGAYDGDDAKRAERARGLGDWLAEELSAAGLSSERALRAVSAASSGEDGLRVARNIAADAITLLLAVSIDYEGYRRDVGCALSEMREIARGAGYLPKRKGRTVWAETRSYSEMKAAAERTLSNTTKRGEDA